MGVLPITRKCGRSLADREGDRLSSRRDRGAADRQWGLSKLNSSSLGMVIGPIGTFRANEREVAGSKPLSITEALPGLGLKLGVLLAVPGLQAPEPRPRPKAAGPSLISRCIVDRSAV
jgi:hypothetical protein